MIVDQIEKINSPDYKKHVVDKWRKWIDASKAAGKLDIYKERRHIIFKKSNAEEVNKRIFQLATMI